MGTFSKDLDLRWDHAKDGRVYWKLLSTLSYTTTNGTHYTVPVGFETDLASIPRAFWPIFPPFWKYAKAAVVHDYLLVSKTVSFREANVVMREGMISLRVNRVQVWVIYGAISFWALVRSIFPRRS